MLNLSYISLVGKKESQVGPPSKGPTPKQKPLVFVLLFENFSVTVGA